MSSLASRALQAAIHRQHEAAALQHQQAQLTRYQHSRNPIHLSPLTLKATP